MKAEPENTIAEIARQHFLNARGSHDWEHTRRVVNLSRSIGRQEAADMTVVVAAAFLHDIGRSCQDDADARSCHAKEGARIAETILGPLSFSNRQKENIIHCVAAHRFRRPPAPETLEAKVVFDADKLDAIGAVGVARAYLFAGELGACLHNPDIDVTRAAAYSKDDTGYREYLVKLCRIREILLTISGQRLAQERHEFMEAFFDRFLREYQGKC